MPNLNEEGWSVVRVPDKFWTKIARPKPEVIEPIYFLRVKAKLGPRGNFGHMGLASREMEITQVLEFREYKELDGVCDIPLPPVLDE